MTPTPLCPIDSVIYTMGSYPGGTVIGTSATGPGYGVQWNTAGVVEGIYQVTATARYGAFPVIATSANNVQISAAPSISLLAPSAGYAYGYSAGQPLTVPLRIAIAGSVQASSVALKLNGATQALTNLGNGQWQATTAPLTPGGYTVTASATDLAGVPTSVTFGAAGPGTAPPTFTVKSGNSAPAIALSASAVSINLGSTVTFTATTQDPDGWVAQVTFHYRTQRRCRLEHDCRQFRQGQSLESVADGKLDADTAGHVYSERGCDGQRRRERDVHRDHGDRGAAGYCVRRTRRQRESSRRQQHFQPVDQLPGRARLTAIGLHAELERARHCELREQRGESGADQSDYHQLHDDDAAGDRLARRVFAHRERRRQLHAGDGWRQRDGQGAGDRLRQRAGREPQSRHTRDHESDVVGDLFRRWRQSGDPVCARLVECAGRHQLSGDSHARIGVRLCVRRAGQHCVHIHVRCHRIGCRLHRGDGDGSSVGQSSADDFVGDAGAAASDPGRNRDDHAGRPRPRRQSVDDSIAERRNAARQRQRRAARPLRSDRRQYLRVDLGHLRL